MMEVNSSSRDHDPSISSALELYEAELFDLTDELEALDYVTVSADTDYIVGMSVGNWRCIQAFLKVALSSAKQNIDAVPGMNK